VQSIPRWQYQFLGAEAVPKNIGELEFTAFFTFSPYELGKLRELKKPVLRLGAALQLGFVRMTGRVLSAVKVVPAPLLKHIGQQLEVQAPTIASLRAIYQTRMRTLWEHQAFALDLLHYQRPTERQFKRLLPYLREQARSTNSVDELTSRGRVWLYQHHFVVSGDRRIRDFAREALAESDTGLLSLIQASVTFDQRARWESELLAINEETGRTWLEWLQKPPRRKSIPSTQESLARRKFLMKLGVDSVDMGNITRDKLDAFAGQLFNMKPADYKQLREPARTLRLACFLKMMLLQSTDTTFDLASRMTTSIHAKAYRNVQELEVKASLSARSLLNEIFELHDDPSITDKQFRALVAEIKAKTAPSEFPTRAAAARWQLSEPNPQIRNLLNIYAAMDLKSDVDSITLQSLEALQTLYKERSNSLPDTSTANIRYPRPWRDIIEGPDRKRAMCALEAATLLGLRRALRSGAVWTEQSESYRSKEKMLIDRTTWDTQKRRFYQHMGLPTSADDFFKPLTDQLENGLERMAEAVEAGDIVIEEGRILLPRLKAIGKTPGVAKQQEALFDRIPNTQISDAILDIDASTGFTRVILGRPARSELELLQVYAGMLAHGAALHASTVSLMIAQLTPEQVLAGMELFENKTRIREANDTVASFVRHLPISSHWGDGSLVASDMISLDVSPQVWAARSDYRRKTASMGSYTHMADFRSIVADQPIILNERQVGPALDGALRQTEFDVKSIAVDTHGYTDFGNLMAKMMHFALCPRLAKVGDRPLYVPRSCKVPAVLREVVDHTLSLRLPRAHYDDLVRVASSIMTGQTTATLALSRFGSSAIDNPVYRAGVYGGRLVRSNYLCDYFTIEELQRVTNRALVLGESVHQLQRAINQGDFSRPRGRREVEQFAMSGSLTLIANICIAWTARQIQMQVAAQQKAGTKASDFAWLSETSPARFQKINFRGTFRFPLERYYGVLIGEAKKAANG